ncbi:B3 domain-containing transcription factor VRN1-like isoform X2 [Mercurialis annua]|uniref:B3 domain-containing transcription factor VRN1-like isoform X2 n=1 Tax=Mercurialis annua TaxID=3986 RepID=UPI0021609741|nr:B3 domain-containing transcription factor VRN1-like isoform X2 [Mercurialis annua]
MGSCSNKDIGFFKIILPDTIRDKKLELPRKFVAGYGNELSNPMTLNVCSGAKWPVEIFKCDDGVFLRNGLQDFIEFYSLVFRCVLFFEFDRKQICFNVIIFDDSTVEINYPISLVEESDFEIVSTRKSNGKSPFSVPPRPSEKLNVDYEEGTESEFKAGERIITNYRSLTRTETLDFIRKARAKFRSEKPYFIIVMQTSFVDPEYNSPTIPKTFAGKFLQKDYDNVILKSSDGGSWSVAYSYSSSRGRFQVGWRPFVHDNKIEAGDVCAFELMNGTKIKFKVTIFRDVKPENFCLSLGQKIIRESLTREETVNLIQQVNSHFRSKFPYFILAMQASLVDPVYNLPTIPKVFAVQHLRKDHGDVIFIGPDGRSWPLEYSNSYSHGKERRRFHVGWKEFVLDNPMQAGDVCAFEMIDSVRITFRVTIFRDIKPGNFCSSSSDDEESETEFSPGPSGSFEHERQNIVDLSDSEPEPEITVIE